MRRPKGVRYDPLYRTIAPPWEFKAIEDDLHQRFERLRRIANLGLIPEVVRMARYPKYEHHIGAVHQVTCLFDACDEDALPDHYRLPLLVAAIFLHLGHLPFTYSGERAMLLSANMGPAGGQEGRPADIREIISARMDDVLQELGIEPHRAGALKDDVLSMRRPRLLNRFFAAHLLLNVWDGVREQVGQPERCTLRLALGNLVDPESDGYRILHLADEADYVQRDALYLGTPRLHISTEHYARNLSDSSADPDANRLLAVSRQYLSEGFYEADDVVWFSRLFEKILASALLSGAFDLAWLEEYDDAQLRRLLTSRRNRGDKRVNLSPQWTKRAKRLFQHQYHFQKAIHLRRVPFDPDTDIIQAEYDLLGKSRSLRGLLRAPFDTGVLLDIGPPTRGHTDHQHLGNTLDIGIFTEQGNCHLDKLLDVLSRLAPSLSFNHMDHVRRCLGSLISPTSEVRMDNLEIVRTLARAIQTLARESSNAGKPWIQGFVDSVSRIKSYSRIWRNPQNLAWGALAQPILRGYLGDPPELTECRRVAAGILSLPVRLLQYKPPSRHLKRVADTLLQQLVSCADDLERGPAFELLCLLDQIKERRGTYQVFINGLVLVDPSKPPGEQDLAEHDIVELRLRGDKPECTVFACSISRDCERKNREKLTALVDHVRAELPDMNFFSYYCEPQDAANGDFTPQYSDTGRSYRGP